MDMLTPEKGINYQCHFSLKQRKQALKMANNISKAATVSGNRAAILLKALFTGKVVIPTSALSTFFPETAESCPEKTFMQRFNISKITTQYGVDPVRKRGIAKDYKRQLVVRTWPFQNLNHPGHSALSVEDKHARPEKNKSYLSWGWSESGLRFNKGKRIKNAFLKLLGFGHYISSPAENEPSYKLDKSYQISPKTNVRLMRGEEDYNKENDDYRERFPKATPLSPRPRQKRLKGMNDWGMQADKVYLPPIGPNSDGTSQEKFIYFGLANSQIYKYSQTHIEESNQQKAIYDLFSTKNNCSGKILEALKAGGGQWYGKLRNYRLFPTPNDVHKVAVQLQQKIDHLNIITNELSETSKALLLHDTSQPHNATENIPKLNEARTPVHCNRLLKKHFRQLQKTARAMDSFFMTTDSTSYQPLKAISIHSFMPKAAIFVQQLHNAWQHAHSDAERQALLPAFAKFEEVKRMIEHLHSLDSESQRSEESPITPI